MKRAIIFLTIVAGIISTHFVRAQESVIRQINEAGKFDNWSVRSVKESDIIGGKTKLLYEFYGNQEVVETREPLVKPAGYLWRTNNVLAVVAGVVKGNVTVFPEARDNGWCARIETHIEEVKALGINMEVVCQGAMIIGDIYEPIKNTKDPLAKVLYGVPFTGRPSAMVFDYKADVGHEVIRGTGFSKLKNMGYQDYPEISIILQKRWEDENGNIHALRVGTGQVILYENADDWVNDYRLCVKYGDISSEPYYRDFMALKSAPDNACRAINSKGKNVIVPEEGWAEKNETPNWMIITFLSSCGEAFHGGVGNILWIDNVRLEM